MRAILLIAPLLLAACATRPPPAIPAIPHLPALSSQTSSPCPPADLLQDPSLGVLAIEDAKLAILYAACQAKHAAAVASYNAAKAALGFESK